jgi:YesN/AraC family two-component response regulator
METKELFNTLLKNVTTANDGQEALSIYKQEHFDIVVTYIKMPFMNGVELTAEIKEINQDQCIIVASAYNDNEYLLDFINLNIKQFMQKPIKMNNMLEVLYDVSKKIVNAQLVEKYRKELESNNTQLKDKNDELQSLVRILDSKITQIAQKSCNQIMCANFENITFSSEHLDELKELEIDISGASVLISLSKNLSLANIQVLSNMFLSYSTTISNYKEFEELASSIKDLANALNNAPQNFIDRVSDISILLETFIYVLRMWRKNLVENNFKKAFELHASMVNDITTIISIIDGTENDIKTQIEFF